MRAPPRERWLRLAAWLPFVLVGYGPVAYLIARTFFPSGGGFSLEAYARVLGSAPGAAERRATLVNSLELGALVVAACLAAGVPFGFLVARTDLKLRRIYEGLAVVPLLLPPYLAGIAWVQVRPMHGLPAIVFILGSSLLPVVILLAARAFREIDRDVEDSARLQLGEGRALLQVTLPLARGAITAAGLLVFVFAVSDFVVPDFFSFAVASETTFQVFATEVYGTFATARDPMTATATAVPLAALAGIALLVFARAERRGSVGSVTGSHAAPRPFRLGRAEPLAHLFLVAVVAATALVPIGSLARLAFKSPGPPPVVPQAPANPGGAPPVAIDVSPWLDSSPVASALERHSGSALASLRNAAAAAALMLLLGIGPARALARSRRVSFAARALVLLPLAFPSLLIGMAHHQLFLAPAGLLDRIHRGWGLVSITLAARFLPVVVLALAASFRRVDPEVEEAAALAPIGPAKRWQLIVLPLFAPGLAAVFVVGFGLALREFDSIVLLAAAQDMLSQRINQLVHYGQDAVVGALALMQVATVLVPWCALRWFAAGRAR